MSSPRLFSRFVIAMVAFSLCGGPEIVAAQEVAQQSQTQTQTQTESSNPQSVGTTPQSATPDPSKGPLQPTEQLPDAPSTAQKPDNSTNEHKPLGAAAAQIPETSGGAASKPAGTAIAPAKQRQMRSLFIKIGAVAAGAAAAGIIYGLTRGTPSVPPGANTSTSTSAASAPPARP